MTRFKLGLTDDPEAEREILTSAFPGAKIERGEGGIIIRGIRNPTTGVEKDLLVDERSPNFPKDVADLSNVLLETIGAVALTAATSGASGGAAITGKLLKSQSVRNAVKQGFAGLTGAIGAGTVGEVAVGGDPLTRLDTLPEEAALEAGLQMLGPILGRVVDQVALGARGLPENRLIEALGEVKQATGEDIQMTAAELMGRKQGQIVESIAEKSPLGSKSLKDFRNKSEAAFTSALQSNQLLGEALPNRLATNTQALQILNKEVLFKNTSLFDQDLETVREASNVIGGMIEAATPRGGGSAFNRQAGETARKSLEGIHKQFKVKSDELFQPILRDDPSFSKVALDTQVKEIKKNLAKKIVPEKVVKNVSPILDPLGNEIVSETVTPASEEIIKKLSPAGLLRMMEGFSELPDNVPLSQLRELRTQINEAISDTEILKSVPSNRLRAFSASLTKTINEGAAALPTGRLKADLDAFNSFYASNIGRFQQPGIEDFLADSTKRKIDSEDVVSGAFKPSNFFRLKDALTKDLTGLAGADSVEVGKDAFDNVKRTMLAELTDQSLGAGSLIKAKDFADKVASLDREVAKELLGPQARAALNQVRDTLTVADQLPADRLAAILQDPKASARQITQLARNVKKENNLYKNNIIKSLVKDKVDPSGIVRSDEFVEKFLQVGTKSDIGEVMDIIKTSDPDLVEDIRRLTIEGLLRDTATGKITPEGVIKKLDGGIDSFDATKMAEILGDEVKGGKLKLVIGEDAFDLLSNLTVIRNVRDKKDAAAAAGGFVANSLANNLFNVSTWPQQIKHKVIASALANPRLRSLLSRSAPLDTTTLAKTMAVSTPVIEAFLTDYPEGVGEVVALMTNSVLGSDRQSIIDGLQAKAQEEAAARAAEGN